jgi:outer membrane protein OmpA-like peptidoglycan-associated protein
MKLRAIFSQSEEQEDQWISISDMMAGLMMIFLIIAIINLQKLQSKVDEFNILQDDIYDDLYAEFKDDLENWSAKIDKETLTISFREPKIQFDTGQSKVKDEFKEILTNFFPRYLKVLKSYNKDIEEIRIEGHTSSGWENAANLDEAYLNNMSLSQDRSKQVLIYCLSLEIEDNKIWAKNLIIANGLSSSKLIYLDENKITEDTARSQRTEFRVKVDSTPVLRAIKARNET